MKDQELIAVSIVALVEDQANGNPIVVLHDQKNNRLLPIWIGDPEARSIAMALNRASAPRPLTHTLLLNIVAKMGGTLARIVVDRLKNHTYFASVYVRTPAGEIPVDARPSDSIALALEARAPIFVAKKIMDEAAQPNPLPGMGTNMRQEKRELRAEDFAKLKELLELARAREQSSGNAQ